VLGRNDKGLYTTVKPHQICSANESVVRAGYNSVACSYYNYLVHDGPYMPKPVMITTDDTVKNNTPLAQPKWKKYGFKGVFFVMTVSINRPNTLSKNKSKIIRYR
jgi:peptidoglycan/xylan/chitin deacetylase (PgdA/CDA1 family)